MQNVCFIFWELIPRAGAAGRGAESQHLSMFTAQKMSEVVSGFFGRNAECLVLLLLGWSIRELTSCRAAAVFLSLPLFLLLEDAIKLQTTNVILQIKGAA